MKPARPTASRADSVAGYLMMEALVYMGAVFIILGVGYAALYRCIDRSAVLRCNAADIGKALHAGERWRADVRLAGNIIQAEPFGAGQIVRLDGASGEVAYLFNSNSVFRCAGGRSWTCVLPNVRSSVMAPDQRQHVQAWRWEIELQPERHGTAKSGRVRPLFTFIAVPETSSTR